MVYLDWLFKYGKYSTFPFFSSPFQPCIWEDDDVWCVYVSVCVYVWVIYS